MRYKFKYFNNVMKHAEFTDGENCQSCNSSEYCLEGIYFDQDEVTSVCLECLQDGIIKVNIPNYVLDRMNGPGKESKIKELEKTPPVPWVQYNDWPVCCNDFTKYLGEWEKRECDTFSNNGDGLNYLLSILEPSSKQKIQDVAIFWESIGNFIILFVFECLHCMSKVAIPQSY